MLISQYFRRLIFASCVGLGILPTPLKSAELITLTNGEWPPFTSKHLPHQGFYSEIVRQAFALEGYQVEYQFLPWARAYMYVKQGKMDGSLTWAKTEKKEQEVLFSDPVYWHTKVFFHLNSELFEWKKISDLHGFTIGATELYTYGHAFDSAAKNGEINVEYVSSDLLNFKKMLLNRVQLFPSDIMVGKTLIQQHFSAEQAALFTYHPKSVQQTYTHVIFSKKNNDRNQRLLAAFNRGLAKLKSSGRYQKIVDNAILDSPE